MGFGPTELPVRTDVPYTSVHNPLARLQEKDSVRTVDSYWAVTEDIAASEVVNVVRVQQIDAEYSKGADGDDDEWADNAPDLGKHA